ncbi:DUF1775 domain-containing protein [Kitasatospora herbaricolor]|uniref:DUF1775 domain-containing protein n=1 Tax=Kitasatospora herbaricolor TaxID=68217 RepID=UPI0036D930AF
MPNRQIRRAARAATVLAFTTGAVTLAGTAAFAHVEVESETAQALATNATVAFTAEAESTTAGLAKFQVVLPEGIAPADVTLADAPAGWAFAATPDGYTVGGAALAPGKDAAYKITVRQLPDAKELVFKTLETYSDGHIERWIELPKAGAEPEHPAPVLKLSPAAPGATPVAPATASPTVAAPSPSPSPSASATASGPAATPSAAASTAAATDTSSSGDSSSPVVPVVIAVAAAAVLAAAGTWWWRRRDRGTGS